MKALFRWVREARAVELANELPVDTDSHLVANHFHRYGIPLAGLEIKTESSRGFCAHRLDVALEFRIGSFVDPLQVHQPRFVVCKGHRFGGNTQPHDMSGVNRFLIGVVENNTEPLAAVESE